MYPKATKNTLHLLTSSNDIQQWQIVTLRWLKLVTLLKTIIIQFIYLQNHYLPVTRICHALLVTAVELNWIILNSIIGLFQVFLPIFYYFIFFLFQVRCMCKRNQEGNRERACFYSWQSRFERATRSLATFVRSHRSLRSIALQRSIHELAHSLRSFPRGTVAIHESVFMLRSRSKETNAIVVVTRNTL